MKSIKIEINESTFDIIKRIKDSIKNSVEYNSNIEDTMFIILSNVLWNQIRNVIQKELKENI